MAAAERIVEDGGTIFLVSECRDGIPVHGNYLSLLRKGGCPESVDRWIRDLDEPILDQWEAQYHMRVLKQASVYMLSSLSRKTLEGTMIEPIDDLQSAVEERLRALGEGAEVAVLPDGPLTIPYLEG